jgi:hypothetical protein
VPFGFSAAPASGSSAGRATIEERIPDIFITMPRRFKDADQIAFPRNATQAAGLSGVTMTVRRCEDPRGSVLARPEDKAPRRSNSALRNGSAISLTLLLDRIWCWIAVPDVGSARRAELCGFGLADGSHRLRTFPPSDQHGEARAHGRPLPSIAIPVHAPQRTLAASQP